MFGSAHDPPAFEPSIGVTRLPPAAFEEASAPLTRIEAEARQRRPGRETMERLVLVELLVVVSRCFSSGHEKGNVGHARFRIEEAVAGTQERTSLNT